MHTQKDTDDAQTNTDKVPLLGLGGGGRGKLHSRFALHARIQWAIGRCDQEEGVIEYPCTDRHRRSATFVFLTLAFSVLLFLCLLLCYSCFCCLARAPIISGLVGAI